MLRLTHVHQKSRKLAKKYRCPTPGQILRVSGATLYCKWDNKQSKRYFHCTIIALSNPSEQSKEQQPSQQQSQQSQEARPATDTSQSQQMNSQTTQQESQQQQSGEQQGQQQQQQQSQQQSQQQTQQQQQQAQQQKPPKLEYLTTVKHWITKLYQILTGKNNDLSTTEQLPTDPTDGPVHTLEQSLAHLRKEKPDLYEFFIKFAHGGANFRRQSWILQTYQLHIEKLFKQLLEQQKYYDIIVLFETIHYSTPRLVAHFLCDRTYNYLTEAYITAISKMDLELQIKKLQQIFPEDYYRKDGYFHVPIFGYLVANSGAYFLIILLMILFGFGIFRIISGGSGGGGLGGIDRFGGKKFGPVELPQVKFKDVIGNDEAKADLFDIVEYLKNPEIFESKNIKVPKGVLMTGPPGCGKTLLARSVAGEAGVKFFNVTGSEFEEVYYGLGASRVRKLFQLARENQPSIIFIDEIDALGPPRNAIQNSRASLNQLLVELDGFSPRDHVIVIAATNLYDGIDSALLRPGRFDRKVHLSLPHKREREQLFNLYLKKQRLKQGDDVDVSKLAAQTQQMSGADISSIINWAAVEATKKNRDEITMEYVENALMTSIIGKEKKNFVVSQKERERTAYHEGGHALVSLLTEGAQSIRKATIIPRGTALGLVSHYKTDETSKTYEELIADIRVSLGGRIAEEIIFGSDEISSGASSDFKNATRSAKAIVCKAGMDPVIGKYFVDEKQEISSETKKLLEKQISTLIEDQYSIVQKLLNNNVDKLHALAKGLLTHDTLDEKEIRNIINGDTKL